MRPARRGRTRSPCPTRATWKVQARATDTAGQADLDTADRAGSSPTTRHRTDGVDQRSRSRCCRRPRRSPSLVAPGSPITFSGSATDDEALATRRDQPAQHHDAASGSAADGTWGANCIAGWYRISPANMDRPQLQLDLHDAVRPRARAATSFSVRAGDDIGPDAPRRANQGRLTINAQVPGDAPPERVAQRHRHDHGGQVLHLDLAGTATDDKGVAAVRVSLLRTGHQPLPAAQRHPWPRRSPPSTPTWRTPDGDQHHLDAAGRPAHPGRLGGDGVRLRHRGPAGHLDHRSHGAIPDLPG